MSRRGSTAGLQPTRTSRMDVVMQGMLTKRGNVRKSWKKRMAVLYAAGSFVYFNGRNIENPEKAKGTIDVPNQVLDIQEGETAFKSDVTWPKGTNSESCFILVTATRKWYFVAKDAANRALWTKLIHSVHRSQRAAQAQPQQPIVNSIATTPHNGNGKTMDPRSQSMSVQSSSSQQHPQHPQQHQHLQHPQHPQNPQHQQHPRPTVILATDVGRRCNVRGFCAGVVRYVGPMRHGNGRTQVGIGVQLDNPIGMTNGVFEGVPYFQCPPKCGVLVDPTTVTLLPEPTHPTVTLRHMSLGNAPSLSLAEQHHTNPFAPHPTPQPTPTPQLAPQPTPTPPSHPNSTAAQPTTKQPHPHPHTSASHPHQHPHMSHHRHPQVLSASTHQSTSTPTTNNNNNNTTTNNNNTNNSNNTTTNNNTNNNNTPPRAVLSVKQQSRGVNPFASPVASPVVSPSDSPQRQDSTKTTTNNNNNTTNNNNNNTNNKQPHADTFVQQIPRTPTSTSTTNSTTSSPPKKNPFVGLSRLDSQAAVQKLLQLAAQQELYGDDSSDEDDDVLNTSIGESPAQQLSRRTSMSSRSSGAVTRTGISEADLEKRVEIHDLISDVGLKHGILRYVGFNHADPDPDKIYCGVELFESIGSGNGTFEGKVYFQCESARGVLIEEEHVKLVPPDKLFKSQDEWLRYIKATNGHNEILSELRQKALYGDQYAALALGMLQVSGEYADDIDQAPLNFQKACDVTNSEGMYQIALTFMRQDGEGFSEKFAVRYLEMAVEQGHCVARIILAQLKLEGKTTEGDNVGAINLLKDSCAQGCAQAMFVLGECYRNNTGMDPHPTHDDKARALLAQAAAQNWPGASASLNEMEQKLAAAS